MSQLPFPAKVLDQHIATLGKTGAGKSSANRVIAEYLLDRKRRLAIVDFKGDWWGLKASASGSGAGYPIVTFGDFKEPYRKGDVPISEHSGREVAELIATGNRPCIIGFRGWMPAQIMRFWLDFTPALFNLNEGALTVIIGEVHNVAPKGKILDPAAGKCLHWTNKLMSEGRGLGLTFVIDSQRPQKVHNDTLDCCETLIAMRVTHPRSRDAAEEWLNAKADPKLAKEVLGTLAELKRGEAWVWSPENEVGPTRVQFPMFQTYDSFAPPQLQKKVITAGWAEIDLEQVKQKLATVIAEAKANDPKELKAQVAKLRLELADRKPAPAATGPICAGPTKKQIEVMVKKATAPALRQLADLKKAAEKTIDRACTELLQFRDGLAGIKIPSIEIPAAAAAPVSMPRPGLAPAIAIPPAPVAAGESNGGIDTGEKAVLLAIAQSGEAERTQITILTGYKRSTRNRYLQLLARKGLIALRADKLVATLAGMAALGSDYSPLPTGIELQRYWLARLPEGEKRILEIVLQSAGSPIDREVISEKAGYERSTRNRYIQILQARKLLKPGAGAIEAAEMLFATEQTA